MSNNNHLHQEMVDCCWPYLVCSLHEPDAKLWPLDSRWSSNIDIAQIFAHEQWHRLQSQYQLLVRAVWHGPSDTWMPKIGNALRHKRLCFAKLLRLVSVSPVWLQISAARAASYRSNCRACRQFTSFAGPIAPCCVSLGDREADHLLHCASSA